MKVNNIYTSVACNRTPEAADWGKNGLIAFGACNSVAIFDPNYDESGKIINTYVKHTKRVNTVKWIRCADAGKETKLISGADDGLAIVWDLSDPKDPKVTLLAGHESGISVVDTIYTKEGTLTIATASNDSTIKLWSGNSDSTAFQCFQTILLKNGFCFAIKLTTFPNTDQTLLTFAGDDDTISLWTEKSVDDKREFHKIYSLTGHEDWVRSLDSIHVGNDLLLASSSQDHFIRLWRVSPRTKDEVEGNRLDVLNVPEGDIEMEEKIVEVQTVSGEIEHFAVRLESVLYGHEGWVYGVQFHQSENGLRLLSSSIDKTMIIWSEDEVWMDQVRVGEVGGGGLGFFGGKFSGDGKAILAHGFQGSFHIWRQSSENDNLWEPSVIVGGHFNEVRDITWEPQGEFFYSVSADQTTRIHAPWFRGGTKQITWHELARPQVHGYDMQAIAVLSRYKFASAAEEKIVRAFEATGNFVDNIRRICGLQEDAEGDNLLEKLPKGASVPSLGLSNKAVYELQDPADEQQERHVKDVYPENYFVPITLSSPPVEEILMQNTLWAETQKLYGHGFEIFALASSSDGLLLASSCRATNAEHAQIILWDTTAWKHIQKLPSHQLTVTQMKFSPNDKYLLSVSRDRTWSVFENKSESGSPSFELAAKSDKTNGIHGRIIWSCDWSHDSRHFVTSSRDGKAIVWTRSEVVSDSSIKDWKAVDILELKGASITAVAFAHRNLNDKENEYIVALGLENGEIHIYKFAGKWEQLCLIGNDSAHHLTVRKLEFRPHTNSWTLASCGDDNLVRVYELEL